jgi:hypothetical protein
LGLTAAQGLIFPDTGAKKSLLADDLPTETPPKLVMRLV